MRYENFYSTRETAQTEQAPGTVANSAGGFSFAVDDWQRLDRFLILGSEGGSYYATENALTRENAKTVEQCLVADGLRTVKRIVEISEGGRAPKNDPAIFALAMCAGLGAITTRDAAYAAIPRVCRTGTHLFHFVSAVQAFRGWGRGLRRGIGAWYTEKAPEKLAYQLVKYRQRDGWTHRDVLRLAHPKPTYKLQEQVLRFAVKGKAPGEQLLGGIDPGKTYRLLDGYEKLAKATSAKEVVTLLGLYPELPWECVPTEQLGHAEVWEALLPNLPVTALVRNLGRMTANGLIKPLSAGLMAAVTKLANYESLRKARLHPVSVLAALVTYQQGHGTKGKLTWTPVPQICDALDAAFYACFGMIEPTKKNYLLGLDVSGSMRWGQIAGIPGLTPAMGAAAMAMVTARTEPNYYLHGFATEFRDLGITAKDTLPTALKKTSVMNFGGTDCALPMTYALDQKLSVDVFVVYTDSETWSGTIHPFQALETYRQRMGRAAKLIVVGMTSNGFTIANPKDGGMLDVVGFDTATPAAMNAFVVG